MSQICIEATISGKVQGVFFRDSTMKKAQSLELTGWVKNTDDGNVCLRAYGEKDCIMKLVDWLWQGPELAQVDTVIWNEINPGDASDWNSFLIQ